MIEINESSVAGIPNITIDIWPTTHWKVLWFRKLDISFRQQQQSGLLSAEDADEIKRIFLETNVYLLAVTGIVTVLHMVFEYLAFSNTIKFWKGKSDFSGLSLKTLGINCYFESITFLYLLESNEASWMILFPAFVGCLVQYWTFAKTVKVSRAASVDSSEAGGFSLCGLKISFPAAYDSKTREYDDKAVKYLTLAMIPFLIGYSIYSALYGEHKGVYSYLIYTQAQFVYFFGFAMMTPQLFINYKLKTVSQLPWRSFVFKSLNTVIDDLFSFIVKMPMAHRIACFRDDVVFAILLYQRWIYPVDKSRREEDNDEIVDEKKNQ
ncbi:transmembrane CLPTM1 family protein [Angomonas deanei]|nr:transmembrane CLPTM1 family protein [Angomonas deanei]|eukprot:EPY43856.1 transmembrane CLPTM1 family protein [Angomonas deanei]